VPHFGAPMMKKFGLRRMGRWAERSVMRTYRS
jgi:hypothetical protein